MVEFRFHHIFFLQSLQNFEFIKFFLSEFENFEFLKLIIRNIWGGLASSSQTVGSLQRVHWLAKLTGKMVCAQLQQIQPIPNFDRFHKLNSIKYSKSFKITTTLHYITILLLLLLHYNLLTRFLSIGIREYIRLLIGAVCWPCFG